MELGRRGLFLLICLVDAGLQPLRLVLGVTLALALAPLDAVGRLARSTTHHRTATDGLLDAQAPLSPLIPLVSHIVEGVFVLVHLVPCGGDLVLGGGELDLDVVVLVHQAADQCLLLADDLVRVGERLVYAEGLLLLIPEILVGGIQRLLECMYVVALVFSVLGCKSAIRFTS